MRHHTDLAEKAQIRLRKTEIVITIFFVFLFALPKERFSITYSTVEVVEAKGNTFALLQ